MNQQAFPKQKSTDHKCADNPQTITNSRHTVRHNYGPYGSSSLFHEEIMIDHGIFGIQILKYILGLYVYIYNGIHIYVHIYILYIYIWYLVYIYNPIYV